MKAIYEVRGPDGRVIEIEGPDNATPEQLRTAAVRAFAMQPAKEPAPYTNGNIGAQLGLTARGMMKGALSLPAMGADAIGGLVNAGLGAAGSDRRLHPTLQTVDGLLTRMGLPEPQSPTEKIVGQAVEFGTGAGAGAKIADVASRGLQGGAQRVASALAANPAVQVTAGAGGGAAGEQAKQDGAGWLGQLGASLTGGLLAGGAVQGLQGAGKAISARVATQPADVQAKVTTALQAQGIDIQGLSLAMRRSIVEDATKAMRTGELDAAALGRLAQYRMLGLTPTRGRLSLDPFDVTAEQNAMRVAAATGAREARLPQIAQENNRGLLSAIEGFGPLADDLGTGSAAMAPVRAKDAAMKAQTKALYDRARELGGGDVPLERGVIQNVYEALNRENRISSVPADIMQTLDTISLGKVTRNGQTFDVPWNINVLDNLKSDLADASRRASGREKAAIKIVRDTLEGMSIAPDKRQFGGGQVVTSADGRAMNAADDAPKGLLDALDAARASHRLRMDWQESAPGIEAALSGGNAESFVRSQIIATSGTKGGFEQVANLAAEINTDPGARDAVRGALMQHLQDAAIGKGNSLATGNMSGRNWGRAVSEIGDRKLGLFFDPDEVARIKAIGQVGSIETFQPRGAAVNNSNTAAGMAGAMQGLARFLKPKAAMLPFGNEILNAPIDNITLSLMQRGATNVPAGLLRRAPTQAPGLLQPYAMPLLLGGGLVVDE